MEQRLSIDGIALDDLEVRQSEAGSNRPSRDETQAAEVECDHISMWVQEGEEASDQPVTTAYVEYAGRLEVEVGDCGEIGSEGIPPPSGCRMEEGVPVASPNDGTWKSAKILVDGQTRSEVWLEGGK
jgi:hypothetical protein